MKIFVLLNIIIMKLYSISYASQDKPNEVSTNVLLKQEKLPKMFLAHYVIDFNFSSSSLSQGG